MADENLTKWQEILKQLQVEDSFDVLEKEVIDMLGDWETIELEKNKDDPEEVKRIKEEYNLFFQKYNEALDDETQKRKPKTAIPTAQDGTASGNAPGTITNEPADGTTPTPEEIEHPSEQHLKILRQSIDAMIKIVQNLKIYTPEQLTQFNKQFAHIEEALGKNDAALKLEEHPAVQTTTTIAPTQQDIRGITKGTVQDLLNAFENHTTTGIAALSECHKHLFVTAEQIKKMNDKEFPQWINLIISSVFLQSIFELLVNGYYVILHSPKHSEQIVHVQAQRMRTIEQSHEYILKLSTTDGPLFQAKGPPPPHLLLLLKNISVLHVFIIELLSHKGGTELQMAEKYLTEHPEVMRFRLVNAKENKENDTPIQATAYLFPEGTHDAECSPEKKTAAVDVDTNSQITLLLSDNEGNIKPNPHSILVFRIPKGFTNGRIIVLVHGDKVIDEGAVRDHTMPMTIPEKPAYIFTQIARTGDGDHAGTAVGTAAVAGAAAGAVHGAGADAEPAKSPEELSSEMKKILAEIKEIEELCEKDPNSSLAWWHKHKGMRSLFKEIIADAAKPEHRDLLTKNDFIQALNLVKQWEMSYNDSAEGLAARKELFSRTLNEGKHVVNVCAQSLWHLRVQIDESAQVEAMRKGGAK